MYVSEPHLLQFLYFFLVPFRSKEVHARCTSLELESHDCIHELVEHISQGPPTCTLLRLQSLGTDYGSDDLGGCTSSEETGQSKDEEVASTIVKVLIVLYLH